MSSARRAHERVVSTASTGTIPEPAEDHQCCDRAEDDVVALKPHQVASRHAESGVVERGDRVEYGPPDALRRRAALAEELDEEDEDPDTFDRQRSQRDSACKRERLPKAGGTVVQPQELSVLHPELAAEYPEHQAGADHVAEAANLNQSENHQLPQERPVGARVEKDVSRQAHRRRRGEECLQRPRRFTRFRRGRDHQKQAPQQKNQREAGEHTDGATADTPARSHLLQLDFHCPHAPEADRLPGPAGGDTVWRHGSRESPPGNVRRQATAATSAGGSGTAGSGSSRRPRGLTTGRKPVARRFQPFARWRRLRV